MKDPYLANYITDLRAENDRLREALARAGKGPGSCGSHCEACARLKDRLQAQIANLEDVRESYHAAARAQCERIRVLEQALCEAMGPDAVDHLT